MLAPIVASAAGFVAGLAAGPVWWHIVIATFVATAVTWLLLTLGAEVWRDRG